MTPRRILYFVWALLLAACPTPTDDPDGDPTDSQVPLMDGGTNSGIPAQELDDCESTVEISPPPVTDTSTIALKDSPLTQGVIHVLDIAVDGERDLLFTAGVGGLFVIDLAQNPPQVLSQSAQQNQTHSMALLDNQRVVLCNRDQGCRIMDTGDPAVEPVRTARLLLPGAAGARQMGNHLIVTTHYGELVVYDLTTQDGQDIAEVSRIDGLGNPWNHVIHDQIVYVADNTLGLVVIDLSDPTTPSIITQIDTPGGIQDLALYDGYLYAAEGGAGIEVFSLANPEQPASVNTLDAGSSIISVSLTSASLWATSHEGVHLWDVSSPENAHPVGFQATDEWAMHVDARGDMAYVADWSRALVMEGDLSVSAPHLDLDKTELYFFDGSQTAQVVLTNRGAGDLLIHGLTIEDTRFTTDLTHQTTLSSMESLTLSLSFEDDGQDVDTQLCLATNDPNHPVIHLPLATSSGDESDLAIGENAIDFVLQDLDGNSHQLAL